ncbi:TPA: hypothetical protein KR304_003509 [Clostridioides difficile]|uniref:type I toxin-antitoxin system toxin n=1 Tax=Clostridioides difficile TaxID=1496 RepID=UPI00093E6DC2|nr:hypothetical protein [Clostridioides difficile]EGT3757673.1 hypothetical protein [Clostridioides difficile]EGT4159425.1 hypothetical protein [Clostridioides difficile]EGT4635083.1 hypothetical protein [Clostridioides difficile]EGT4831757.1 hypothetical protein [Clostridioides difficile]EII6777335.1 hypothetical protein [Clostridioides difficile]
MDNFLQGILERLSASLIVCLVSNLLKKRKKPLKAPTKSGWELDFKIKFHKFK